MVVEKPIQPIQPQTVKNPVFFEDDAPITSIEKDSIKKKQNSAYFRSYYLKNKEKILQRRKHRYLNDPDYREIIQRSKEFAKLRNLEVSNNLESTTISPVATGNPLANRAKKLKIKSPTLGEAVVKFLTIGQLAEAIGIAVATCRKWERMNILPPSNYRNEGGHRLYSIDQAQLATDIYHKHLNKFADKCEKWRLTEDFQKELFDSWQSLHMGVNPNRFKHTDLSKLTDALDE
jgi:hypothetical protein